MALSTVGGTVYPTHPDKYELRAEIGKGAFATVYLAYCKLTDEYVAIKILDLEELDTSWEEIRKEIAVMGLLNHPNVVRCLCSFVVDQEIWLVMPLLSGGSCADIMKRNFPKGFDDEYLIATILREALQGLAYLHKDGRIHRDVKAGNILISTDGEVQIADFGVAGTLVEAGDRRKHRKTFVGTPCWMAPEVMEQTSGYDQKADMWSFGITAFELAFGSPPYAQFQPMKVMILTLQEEPPTPDVYQDNQKRFSRSFRSMVAACLKKDPSKRLTAEKLLQHKFFKQGRNSAYIVDHLLTQIPPTKWNKEALPARSRGASISSLPKDGATEQQAPAVSSWVFDDDELQKLKASGQAVRTPPLPPALAELGAVDTAVDTEIDAIDEPRDAPEPAVVAAVAETETKLGRFTVKVTDIEENAAAATTAAESEGAVAVAAVDTATPTHTRVLTQGRFEVSDIHDDGNKDVPRTP